MPLRSRKRKSRFFKDVPFEGMAPKWLQPARLDRNTVTERNWKKDRLYLDLNRPLPTGSVTKEDLEGIDRGLFLAWNTLQHRWEVWCRREGERRPPYFVVRVVSHPPNVYDEYGRLKSSCPGRPYRSRNSASCPPSCHGKYEIPDNRLIAHLWNAALKNVSANRQADRMDRADERVLEAKERHLANYTEALVSDRMNRLLGIQQVGYTGKRR